MEQGKKWYVVTGGPSSGKSTTLAELKKLGYIVYPEAARILIDREIAKGRSLAEIREDEAEFQRIVLRMKIETEKSAPKDKIIFFDRGIPDSVAYHLIQGFDPTEMLAACEKGVYEKIFLLEQLPFEKDYSRTENEKMANEISRLLKESYLNLDYEVISIPAVSVAERVRIILKEISQ